MSEENINIPNEYRPLSAWGYIGYSLLFRIPLAGFIFAIVFALDDTYIARRNYARSNLLFLLILIILALLIIIIFFVVLGLIGVGVSSSLN